jgi:tRNA (cmo5U34)-methyltransferase
MLQDKITAIFDQQAATYDEKWSELAPINGALHLLTTAVFATLPPDARILCVGAGTGTEILALAQKYPGWRFTAIEPSTAMLEVCRRRADTAGISPRCVFHAGYLDSLPADDPFHGATAFLVSQFILDPQLRAAFFRDIAIRLGPQGLLVSSDLAGDLTSAKGQDLSVVWFRVMKGHGISTEEMDRMREAYARDVAVLPPTAVREIIGPGGFDSPTLFFQAGMIHAWHARRSSSQVLPPSNAHL